MPNPITIQGVDQSVNGRLLQTDNKLYRYATHMADLIKDGQLKRPNAWRDLANHGTYEPFNGESQSTLIFRGTLGEQVGLHNWYKTEASRRGTDAGITSVDACTYKPLTYDWAMESMDYTGFTRSWKSPVVCVRDFYTADKAKEQLGMILKAGSAVVDDTRINFAREIYGHFASLAGHCVVMTDGFSDFIDNADCRFTFDPFQPDTDNSGDQVIMFKASLLGRVSALNWSYLDYCKQWLTDMASNGAVANASGQSVFMAMMDVAEFERYVYNDANLREDFRYASPQKLIDGFDMGMKVYRGIALSHDPQQPRFDLKKIKPAGTSPVTTSDMAVLKRVAPRRHGRAGAIGKIPETNPDYLNAEFGTIIFYLKDVYTILVPKVMTSLGSGTSFGGGPNFNGDWKWICNKGPDTNILGDIGYFFARFEYHPRPEDNATNAIVLLYRRCPGTMVTACERDTNATVEIDEAVTVSSIVGVSLAGVAETALNLADTFLVTMPKPIEVGVGTPVTLTDHTTGVGHTISGYISSTVAAPAYGVKTMAAVATFDTTGAVTIKLT